MGNACFKFFDENNDGTISSDEVMRKVSAVIHIIGALTKQASAITEALKEAGVDTKNALGILSSIGQVVDLAGDFSGQLEKIKIPKSLEEIGDVNQDGRIDKEDLVSYLSASRSVCDSLIQKGIKVDLVTSYRDQIQKVIDALSVVPQLKPIAHSH